MALYRTCSGAPWWWRSWHAGCFPCCEHLGQSRCSRPGERSWIIYHWIQYTNSVALLYRIEFNIQIFIKLLYYIQSNSTHKFRWFITTYKYPISKIRKSLIQNGGLNPHWKFQHSSSIGGLWPQGGVGGPISKIWKSHIQNGGPNPHRKFQHSSSIKTAQFYFLILK